MPSFMQRTDHTGCNHSLDGPTRTESDWEMGWCGKCENQVAYKLDAAGKRIGETCLIVFWNFAVVGCDSTKLPRYLGFTENYEEAVKLQGNMIAVGWRQVAVFDAALREVTEKPK